MHLMRRIHLVNYGISFCNSNADRAAWWELSVLASHVHPSVATMARTLLSGAPIVYNGNPLSDLSLSAFLDKFMEKKPKTNKIAEGKWHGGSSIAPNCKVCAFSFFICLLGPMIGVSVLIYLLPNT